MANDTISNFSQFLALHANGLRNDELTNALNDMIAELSNRVLDQGGKQKGKISLDVNIEIDKGIIEITTSQKATLPRDTDKSVYWATPDNKLTQSNPKQPDMFKDVKGNTGETRTA